MSEAQFRAFQNITAAAEIFVYAGSLAYFFYPFLRRGRERKRNIEKKVLIVAAAYLLLSFAGMVFPLGRWLCLVLLAAILTASSGYLGMNPKLCFLLLLFFFCLQNISRLMAESLFHVLAMGFVWKQTRMEIIFRNTAAAYSIYILLTVLIFTAMQRFLRRRLSDCALEPDVREVCYLGLIPMAGLLFANVIGRLFVAVQGNEVFQLYVQHPAFLWIVPLIAILFYAGIIAAVASYCRMVALREERETYFVKEQQLRALQERMEEVDRFYAGIRRLRHEMKGHLTNIRGLAESGKYAEMEQYITKMDAGIDSFALTVKTGNAVTDVIINDKKKAAEKAGIKFQTEFAYPQSGKYDAYDIGIILNNLLSNALEACEKISGQERYILLSGRQKRKFFLIEVKNSFVGEIEFDRKTNLPISTKRQDISIDYGAFHGIGLSNVKREVEKYMGDLKIKVRENEFNATVLLQERSTGNEYQ